MNLSAAAQPLRVDPADADAAYNAGLGALKSGREEEALALLERARARHPRDARLWQVSALLYRSLDDLGPAVSHFAKAASLSPNDPLIAHGHARAAMEAGWPAIALFERAHRLAPLGADPEPAAGRNDQWKVADKARVCDAGMRRDMGTRREQ